MTAWLTGMLAIASAIMCIGLWPLVKAEWRKTDESWWRNRAFKLALALYIHGMGAIILFASIPLTASDTVDAAVALYLLWGVFGLWLVAKTLIISVTGRLKLCAVLFAAWSAGCALWSLTGGGA